MSYVDIVRMADGWLAIAPDWSAFVPGEGYPTPDDIERALALQG